MRISDIKLSLQRACALTIRLKPLCWLFRCYRVKKKLTKFKTEYAWWVDWSLSRQTLHMSLYFCLRRNLMIWSGWKKTCFLPDIPASQFILWIILPWQQAQHTPLATTWPPTHFMAWPLSSFLQAQTQILKAKNNNERRQSCYSKKISKFPQHCDKTVAVNRSSKEWILLLSYHESKSMASVYYTSVCQVFFIFLLAIYKK